MRRIFLSIFGVLLAFSAVPAVAEVGFNGMGGRVGATIDPDQIHVGVHADLGTIVEHVHLVPNIEIGFGDNITAVSINPEAYYLFPVQGNWKPYAGGGIGITVYSFDYDTDDFPFDIDVDDTATEAGLNLLGGVQGKVSERTSVFFEGKLGVGDIPDFKATAGFTVWFK